MFMVESKEGAIACMILSLFCLGTFPALLSLLERRGRLPQHTYLDYSITNFLAAVLIALALGGVGKSSHDSPNFIQQLSQDNWPSVMFAMAGGVALSLGNLSSQYAWAFVGLSVAEVLTSSLIVVIGSTLNYFLDDKINKAEILFPGVACFVIAVCLGSAVHSSNVADDKAKLESLSAKSRKESTAIDVSAFSSRDLENADGSSRKADVGTADFLVQLEDRRAIKVFGKSSLIGLCFTFSAASCFAIAIVLNVIFLYRPVLGLPKTTFKAYLNDWNGRGWAFLAGFLCGFGNGLEFMGGQAAGYAAADSVQAFPLVSTFWGVILFGEYRRSSRKTYVLLVSMLFMFSVAVGMLMASSGHRHVNSVAKSVEKFYKNTNL
ncbi:ureide permease 2-like isoform X2 [Momordica charantia]|uniref:Ureide permease 2-like isoform X2 n=1 Tax=Momordica charantia TaxID=3673 RepID=A0A6J1D7E8_MOMCH|nr:ureide permease 2-like isoform X2 [Momordica charantia]